MKLLLYLLLVVPLCACQSLERLGRVSPLAGDVAEDRINLWPLYYKNGDEVAVLWPVYDQDEQGFALRPLLTKDDSDWELLPPIAWWNTDSGNWIFIPAYRIDDSIGLVPVVGFGDFNFVGPLWWDEDEQHDVEAYGLFPVLTVGPDFSWATLAWWDRNDEGEIQSHGFFPLYARGHSFNQIGPVVWGYDKHGDKQYFSALLLFGYGVLEDERQLNWAGPAWWLDDAEGQLEAYGLFPLATTSDDFHQVGPVFWSNGEDGERDYLVALPLFGYGNRDDGSGMLLSLLGGHGWDAEGDTTWVNVLGPVYHHTDRGDATSTHLVWPIGHWSDSPVASSWELWPLVGHRTRKPTDPGVGSDTTWALAGLIERVSSESTSKLRVAPLFSHSTGDDVGSEFFDWISLVGYERDSRGRTDLHLGTPLVFNHSKDGANREWSALLGTLDYETDGTDSSFDLLYYLYRQNTTAGETRRDLFPFITWDSGTNATTGEGGTHFSFLWRLINYERKGDQYGGHFLFIPWGTRG